MALNATDMTLQRLAVSLGQLVEQLQVTKSTKRDVQIEDVIKALNLTFKTTKGDITELKSLLKVSKNAGNSAQYEKLIKMLELLVKSYDNPDVKQMSRLGITAQNLIAEFSSLRDEVKSTNIRGNEKANLSLLTQAIAEGQRQYALTGFGKTASNFYKKATLEQMRLLHQINKHIDEGIPLKDLAKKTPLEKAKEIGSKALDNGPLQAAADMVLKGMGFGTLPGEFLDMFKSMFGKKGMSKKEAEQAELQSMKVKGLVDAKEKAQLALDYNRTIQDRAVSVRNTAKATRENLTVELSKSLADAMRISGAIDSRFETEGEPGIADINKILEAVNSNSISKAEIDDILKAAAEKATPENAETIKATSNELMKNFSDVQEYSKIIEEQEKIIAETAKGIQDSIDRVAELFIDLRDILGKELKNELEQLDKIISGMKGIDEETKAGIKSDKITRKLESMSRVAGIAEDELHGIIGGERDSKYMRDYKERGTDRGGRAGVSKLAEEAFRESSFREAIYGETPNLPRSKTVGEEYEDRISQAEQRLKNARVPVPPELNIPKNEPKPIEELNQPSEDNGMMENGLSLEDISSIVSESITEFLKSFEESMKEREKENIQQADILRKALVSGEVKVNVVNLKDIPAPQVITGSSGGGDVSYGASNFGD